MSGLRLVAFLVGLGLLAATAHVTIVSNGGYTAPGAILTMAVALGVAVAAAAIGAAWASGTKVLASWLAVAILAGEAFGFLTTAERLVTGRERTEAPLRAAQQQRVEAAERVRTAEAAVEALPVSSERLDAALKAKQAADAAILEKSASPGCAQNCRLLLQGQADAAAHEVSAARAGIDDARLRAKSELSDARATLVGHEATASATPLADRTGIPAWALDLIAAALGSLAANGLGVGLIAFAAHGGSPDLPQLDQTRVEVLPPNTGTNLAKPGRRKRVVGISDHAAQFAVEALTPVAGGSVDLIELRRAYDCWCNSLGMEPLPAAKVGGALAKLFAEAGIAITEKDGRRIALGVALKGNATQLEHRTS